MNLRDAVLRAKEYADAPGHDMEREEYLYGLIEELAALAEHPAPVAKPRRMRGNPKSSGSYHWTEHAECPYCDEDPKCKPVEVCESLPETCPKCGRKVEVGE